MVSLYHHHQTLYYNRAVGVVALHEERAAAASKGRKNDDDDDFGGGALVLVDHRTDKDASKKKEDDDHPFLCHSPIMRDAQMEEISKLKQKINEAGTYPLLTEVMTNYIKNWFRTEENTYIQRLISNIPLHQSLLQNINDQTEIG